MLYLDNHRAEKQLPLQSLADQLTRSSVNVISLSFSLSNNPCMTLHDTM